MMLQVDLGGKVLTQEDLDTIKEEIRKTKEIVQKAQSDLIISEKNLEEAWLEKSLMRSKSFIELETRVEKLEVMMIKVSEILTEIRKNDPEKDWFQE